MITLLMLAVLTVGTHGRVQCPSTHPRAYFQGSYCCSTDHEKWYSPQGEACDGGPISYNSKCCRAQVVACTNPPCQDNVSVTRTNCPESHPYVYFNGEYCCQYQRENIYSPQGALCDGSVLGFDSMCCKDNKHVACSLAPCQDRDTCQLTKVEILSTNQQRTFAGSQVIGITSSGTCFGSGQSSQLTLAHTSSVEESISIEMSEESGTDWSFSASVSVMAGFELFGVKGEVTVGIEAGGGGFQSYGKSETTGTSTSSGSEMSHSIYYTAPGAGMIVGIVDKYTFSLDSIPVLQHITCSSGRTFTRNSSIKLRQTHYDAAHFEDLRGSFNKAACETSNYSLQTCVNDLKSEYNGFLGDLAGLRIKFVACFAGGKGTVSKKLLAKLKL